MVFPKLMSYTFEEFPGFHSTVGNSQLIYTRCKESFYLIRKEKNGSIFSGFRNSQLLYTKESYIFFFLILQRWSKFLGNFQLFYRPIIPVAKNGTLLFSESRRQIYIPIFWISQLFYSIGVYQ